VRVRIREHDPFGCDPVEKRCLHARIASKADGIGAQSVDRNQDDVVGFVRKWFLGWTTTQDED
jgi:hypothetical protein